LFKSEDNYNSDAPKITYDDTTQKLLHHHHQLAYGLHCMACSEAKRLLPSAFFLKITKVVLFVHINSQKAIRTTRKRSLQALAVNE